MKTQLKRILMAILAVFGRLFALPTSAARRGGDKGGKSSGFNFLPALCVMCFFAVLTACGGGGGGNGNSAVAPAPAPITPPMMTNMVTPTMTMQLVYDLARQPTNAANHYDDRYGVVAVRGSIDVGNFNGLAGYHENLYVPGGTDGLASGRTQTMGLATMVMRYRGTIYYVNSGYNTHPITVRQTAYIADFSNNSCWGAPKVSVIRGGVGQTRGYGITCIDRGTRLVRLVPVTMRNPGGGNMVTYVRATSTVGAEIIRVTVLKTHSQVIPVCYRDSHGGECFSIGDLLTTFSPRGLTNIFGRFVGHTVSWIGLAFPRQTYRRDNGECQSAPFYAADNCQSENAVDVGNFAAFVSGLNGNGYRQFGVRHRFDGDDWNAAAMVSHAKGAEFLDTWWGRLRFEHSVFDDAAAFAEYESGITSLRQNGFLFADIPISGGRVGFRFADFTASFGRPMHYDGKGKNAAAVHWQATKQTEFSFRRHNNNAEVQWQWRQRF